MKDAPNLITEIFGKATLIIEATPDSIIILNEKAEIIYWNGASENIFNYSKEEIIGQPLKTIIPDEMVDFHYDIFHKVLSQTNTDFSSVPIEVYLKRKNQILFPADLTVFSAKEGDLTMLFCVIRDVTSRKKLEQDNLDLKQIIDNSPSCVKLVNKAGKLCDMNRVGLDIIDSEDLETVFMADVYDLVHPDHRQAFIEFNQFICNGGEGSLIFKIITLKGVTKTMETFAVPHTLENGEIGHLAITNDISDRINREKELYQKNLELEEAKRLSVVGEFTAGIAHEINNPLAVISAKTQLLDLELNRIEILDSSVNERMRNSLDIINETVEHVSDLIKNLKTFSGKVDLENMELVALSKPLDMVFKIIKKRCANEGISLSTQADSKLKVYCNSAGLAQALLNLIINAIDANENKKNKWIKIATEESQGKIKILITDSGSGIPPEIAQNMTQPFFTTKQPGKGTGLGLGISLKLIHKMNGNLYYNPKAVNTQFVIELSSTLPN